GRAGSCWTDVGVLDYAHVDTASPIAASAGVAAGSTSSPRTPSITTTEAGDAIVAAFVNFSGGAWTAGSGMTKRDDFDGNTAEDSIQAGAGPTGARSATESVSVPTSAQILALMPLHADTVAPAVTP